MTDVHALSGAYAIDALDDDERALFEQHLADCADCRDEVAGLQEAGAALGLSAATAPPAGLRERVLADIATVRPLPPPVRGTASAPTPAPTDLDERRRRRGRRLGALAAAAAVVAVVGGGVGVATWQPWSDDGPGPSATPGSPTGPVSPSTGAPLAAVEQVLPAPDAETHARALEVGGSATVARSLELNRAVVVTQGLPTLPRDETYQLWLRVDGEMLPAGLMRRDGGAAVLSGDADRAEAIGITVEPAGGSPRPTSQPVAYFPLEDV